MRDDFLPKQPELSAADALRTEVARAVLPALEVSALREEVARRLRAMEGKEGRALRRQVMRLYDLLLGHTCQPELLDFLRVNEARHAVWECLTRKR